MLTLIYGGNVYAPAPVGEQSLLLAGGTILQLGAIDPHDLTKLDLPCTLIDAGDCLVLPGLIDPHEHLIGAGGEHGWSSRMPEVSFAEIVTAGITTVVGCLGTDTTTRHLQSLLAKARQLEAEGVSAYIYTGGFPVPPPTLTGSVTDDLILIDKVIGLGEIAIADLRALEPTLQELARAVSQAIVGGMISGKAGTTHFHVGSSKARLSLLRALLDEHDLEPRYLYPTHITRSEALMDEAIDLSQRGSFVDIDTVEDDFGRWLRYYHAHGGAMEKLTASSDAQTPGGSPGKLFRNFTAAIREYDMPLQEVLPVFTGNPAAALQLRQKGRLANGLDADVLVLRRETFEIVHVFARGRQVVSDGQVINQSNDEAAGEAL